MVPVYWGIDVFQSEAVVRTAVEAHLGGRLVAIVLHGVSAAIAAPLLVEMLLLNTMMFLSLYWLIFVVVLILVFRVVQFAILRITDNPKGPVFAISAFFVAIGGIVKLYAS